MRGGDSAVVPAGKEPERPLRRGLRRARHAARGPGRAGHSAIVEAAGHAAALPDADDAAQAAALRGGGGGKVDAVFAQSAVRLAARDAARRARRTGAHSRAVEQAAQRAARVLPHAAACRGAAVRAANKPRPAGAAGHCAGGGVAAGQPAHAAAAVQRRRQFVGRGRRGGGRHRRQRVAAAGKGKFLPRQGFGHRVCARLAVLQPGGELRQFCEGRRAAAALDAPCVETAQAADGPGVRLHRAGLFAADHTFPHKALRRVAANQTAHAPGSLAAFGAARQLQGQVGYPAALHGPRIAPHRTAGGVAGAGSTRGVLRRESLHRAADRAGIDPGQPAQAADAAERPATRNGQRDGCFLQCSGVLPHRAADGGQAGGGQAGQVPRVLRRDRDAAHRARIAARNAARHTGRAGQTEGVQRKGRVFDRAGVAGCKTACAAALRAHRKRRAAAGRAAADRPFIAARQAARRPGQRGHAAGGGAVFKHGVGCGTAHRAAGQVQPADGARAAAVCDRTAAHRPGQPADKPAAVYRGLRACLAVFHAAAQKADQTAGEIALRRVFLRRGGRIAAALQRDPGRIPGHAAEKLPRQRRDRGVVARERLHRAAVARPGQHRAFAFQAANHAARTGVAINGGRIGQPEPDRLRAARQADEPGHAADPGRLPDLLRRPAAGRRVRLPARRHSQSPLQQAGDFAFAFQRIQPGVLPRQADADQTADPRRGCVRPGPLRQRQGGPHQYAARGIAHAAGVFAAQRAHRAQTGQRQRGRALPPVYLHVGAAQRQVLDGARVAAEQPDTFRLPARSKDRSAAQLQTGQHMAPAVERPAAGQFRHRGERHGVRGRRAVGPGAGFARLRCLVDKRRAAGPVQLCGGQQQVGLCIAFGQPAQVVQVAEAGDAPVQHAAADFGVFGQQRVGPAREHGAAGRVAGGRLLRGAGGQAHKDILRRFQPGQAGHAVQARALQRVARRTPPQQLGAGHGVQRERKNAARTAQREPHLGSGLFPHAVCIIGEDRQARERSAG